MDFRNIFSFFITELYRRTHVERLAPIGFKTTEKDDNLICNIIQNVYVHPSANVHPTATVTLQSSIKV